MGDVLVDQNQLEQIGNYVKSHIGQWLKDQHILTFPEGERSCSDKELLERMITVEQQLKFQNEKLEMMMDQSDKRFDAVDKRFNRLYVFLTGIFLTMLAGFIPLIIRSFN